MTKRALLQSFQGELQAALLKFPQSDIMVLFSGGMDSSAVGILAALAFPNKKISLLSCNNGSFYPEELRDKTRQHAMEIAKLSGHKQIHLYYLDVRAPFVSFGVRYLQEDVDRFKSSHLCLACKMCMQAVAAIWGSQNNSFIGLDGYNKTQKVFPEQLEEVQQLVRKGIEEKAGVIWRSPLFNIAITSKVQDELLELLGTKPEIHDREKGGQAACALGGNFQALFGEADCSPKFREYKRNAVAYIRERLPVLLSDQDLIEKRERGVFKKPSYWQQLKQAALQAEQIL